jgi:FtsP/CotA-like multicopper oxidase with cupredoxin domain
MKNQLLPMSRIGQALLLAGLVTAAAPALAVEYWLRADTVNVTMPDGVSVPMWGYALTDATFVPGTASVPGPALTVPPGDTVLTIHLKNNLPEATSIVIPGQVTAMTPVWDNGMSGARPSASARVRSFTHEALVGGGTADYTWSNVKPGTYLYHSGTHPQVQVQMGLYGGVSGNAVAATASTPAEAYAGVAYNNEVTLLFSEIDPALHAAVAGGTYGTAGGPTSTFDYRPKYFLINGQPYAAGAAPLAVLPAGEKTLLRFLNAGLKTHVPVINGQYLKMIAEDGNPYPWPANPRQQYSVLLPAAKTVDAILTPQLSGTAAPTRYAVYDRRLDLTSGAAQDGGMLAMLEVAGTGTAPAIISNPTLTATQNQSYAYKVTASDADGGPLSFTLDKAPAGMTIKTTSNFVAWIGWWPTSAQVGTQAVTVRATDPTGLSTTQSYSIAVANVNDRPLVRNDAYTMIKGSTLNVASPGVLANDNDPDVGDTLTATNYGTPKVGTLTGNADGSFSYTPPATYTGMDSFAYLARDNHGVASKNAGWVSIAVRANRAPVTVDDAPSTAPNTTLVINVLGNDSDLDTAIDPANTIDPATVFIPLTGKPNQGGTVTVNADGTISYTPKLNFTGTEVFQYAVKDTYNPAGISKAAYVRVNVQ